MSAAFTYATDTQPRQAFTGSMKLIEGFAGRVVRSDGKVVWTSAVYRTAKAARLQANAQLKPLREYLADNGRCWYDDQTAKRDAKEAARRARKSVHGKLATAISHGINARLEGKPFDAFPDDFTPSQKMAFQAGWADAADLPPETPILNP